MRRQHILTILIAIMMIALPITAYGADSNIDVNDETIKSLHVVKKCKY